MSYHNVRDSKGRFKKIEMDEDIMGMDISEMSELDVWDLQKLFSNKAKKKLEKLENEPVNNDLTDTRSDGVTQFIDHSIRAGQLKTDIQKAHEEVLEEHLKRVELRKWDAKYDNIMDELIHHLMQEDDNNPDLYCMCLDRLRQAFYEKEGSELVYNAESSIDIDL